MRLTELSKVHLELKPYLISPKYMPFRLEVRVGVKEYNISGEEGFCVFHQHRHLLQRVYSKLTQIAGINLFSSY